MIDELKSNLAYSRHLEDLGHAGLSPQIIQGLDALYSKILPSDKDAQILDFGCGCGDFLEYLKNKGYSSISGCDINPNLVDFAQKRLGTKIDKLGDLSKYCKSNSESFKFINLKDVLEHIPKEDAVSFLTELREMLDDSGKLLISCPQICGFTSLFTLYDDFTHKTLFTENSLRYLLAASGYKNATLVRPNVKFSFKPWTICFRLMRRVWFNVLRIIYLLERPGERMPTVGGDRISMLAEK